MTGSEGYESPLEQVTGEKDVTPEEERDTQREEREDTPESTSGDASGDASGDGEPDAGS